LRLHSASKLEPNHSHWYRTQTNTSSDDQGRIWFRYGHKSKVSRLAPAMALGVTDHVWSVTELVNAATTEAPDH
jgi:hypothetical protein